jgi:hypothetical protein
MNFIFLYIYLDPWQLGDEKESCREEKGKKNILVGHISKIKKKNIIYLLES